MKNLLRKALNGISFFSKDYDSCPNCGDNWWWKKGGLLYYSESFNFHICKKCLADPWRLGVEKIVQELRRMKPYREETLEKIKQAVITYKRVVCGHS